VDASKLPDTVMGVVAGLEEITNELGVPPVVGSLQVTPAESTPADAPTLVGSAGMV
jgi:phosphoribosylformylglycinamidine (FGAM) synthase-like enzyme